MAETGFTISEDFIQEQNKSLEKDLNSDYEALAGILSRRGLDADSLTSQIRGFTVAVPSWGLGTGGTRFGRFPNDSEPRDVFEKMVDASTVNSLGGGATPRVSLHIPWDKPQDPSELKDFSKNLGLAFDAMNSNTFQDQKDGQELSYKFGSLTHTDAAVRQQAVDHNLEVIELGKELGSGALTVWIGDGGSYPGQVHFRRSLDRLVETVVQIYKAMPEAWRLFTEHKPYEPSFYYTVNCDWGTSCYIVTQVGERAQALVDLGHHLPNTNIEVVVSRLITAGKLGGFHLNDSKYGDDDLSTGSIHPYQLFLIFNELVDAGQDPSVKAFDPAYMLDQSHNLKDPIEDLVLSGVETRRAFAKALIVDRAALEQAQDGNDVARAEQILKTAYETDVTPLLAMARSQGGGALDPLSCFRASGYRREKGKERPQKKVLGGGIV